MADLPNLADDGVTVDGYTQPGARPNTPATLEEGSDTQLKIALDVGEGPGEQDREPPL